MHDELNLTFKGDNFIRLEDEKHETCWVSKAQSIISFAAGDASKVNSDISVQKDGQTIWMDVKLENKDVPDVRLEVDFPCLVLNSEHEISYCFPSLNPTIGKGPIELKMPYSTWYPMQFMGFWNDKRAVLTLMSQDRDNFDKSFIINKSSEEVVRCAIRYKLRLEQSQPVVLHAILVAGEGDWHESLMLYRSLWHKSHAQSQRNIAWLPKTYLFRQWFMHKNYDEPVFNERTGVFTTEQKFSDDISLVGDVDYVQIFDWAYEPGLGRLGKYTPWEYLRGSHNFEQMLDCLHKKGVHTGIYFEGYLLGRDTPFADDIGGKAHVRKENNMCYSYSGEEYYTLCPGDGTWTEWLQSHISDTLNKLVDYVDAVYIDEYCCGEQYPCHSELHSHVRGRTQIQREKLFLQELRKQVPLDKSIITEYFPSDESIALVDASLTYANPLVNLSRFAFPEFKQFVIIKCDMPLHNDVEAAKRIFFNGQGIWLSGNLHDEEWFGGDFLKFVRKMHKIQRNNNEFESLDCTPLLYGGYNDIAINEFRGKDTVIWTLYNVSKERIKKSYRVPEGMRTAIDIWNEKNVVLSNFEIAVDLECGEIGCVKFAK